MSPCSLVSWLSAALCSFSAEKEDFDTTVIVIIITNCYYNYHDNYYLLSHHNNVVIIIMWSNMQTLVECLIWRWALSTPHWLLLTHCTPTVCSSEWMTSQKCLIYVLKRKEEEEKSNVLYRMILCKNCSSNCKVVFFPYSLIGQYTS